ncbi:MAG: hypothetical protein HY567_02500 [Candidatus Kerfeldbacteria bacterium]|nr:hypothetical protein [Candidatus Kerfeldbacteria bacterium]
MRRLLPTTILGAVLLVSIFVTPNVSSPLLSPGLLTPSLLLILLLGDTRLALLGALIGGFTVDLFSALPFGSHLIAYVATITATRWIFRTRITNRSFLAFLSLVSLGTILTHVLILVASHLGRLLDPQAASILANGWWFGFVLTDVMRTIVIAIIVYVTVRLSGRTYATLVSHEF